MFFIAQIALLIAWYLLPAFAHLPLWLVWAPTILGAIFWAGILAVGITAAAVK